jgi:hypothetical protein
MGRRRCFDRRVRREGTLKALRIFSVLLLMIAPHRAFAWGDDGHKTIAILAEQYLEPSVKTKIAAMLDADPDNLTPHDLASAATWAAKYRDGNNRCDHYEQTQTGTSSTWKSMIPI